MSNTLKNKNLKAIILECNTQNQKYEYNFSEIESILLDYGFNKYDYDPFKRDLIKLDNNMPLNIIFIRDFDFVNQRIKSSPKVKFNGINF